MSGNNKVFGYELLRRQIVQRAMDEVAYMEDEAIGDSPIEKLLCSAIKYSAGFAFHEYTGFIDVTTEAEEIEAKKGTTFLNLIIRPQAKIEEYRVDFLIHAYDFRGRTRGGWRKLVIECDGHEFHERTKEQAKRDRSRDRILTLQLYTVLRFTGSEIHCDPIGCAEQVFDWASRGL
jgi:very-short-patch-repair endonuclease